MNISDRNKFPTTDHFAIIVFKTEDIYHEGDERSRTHPGHGYPAYTETVSSIEYISFADKNALEQWIITTETKTYSYGNDKPVYQAVFTKPLAAKINATVKFD